MRTWRQFWERTVARQSYYDCGSLYEHAQSSWRGGGGGSSPKAILPPGYATSRTPAIAKSLREYGNTSFNSYTSFELGMLIFEMWMLTLFLLSHHITNICCSHTCTVSKYTATKLERLVGSQIWQIGSLWACSETIKKPTSCYSSYLVDGVFYIGQFVSLTNKALEC